MPDLSSFSTKRCAHIRDNSAVAHLGSMTSTVQGLHRNEEKGKGQSACQATVYFTREYRLTEYSQTVATGAVCLTVTTVCLSIAKYDGSYS